MKWGFQLVHHDLWDYDSAAPPLLATIVRAGAQVPVVVQGNKSGFLYVLEPQHRRAGVRREPNARCPPSTTPGEAASPTQPYPLAPPAVSPQTFTPDDAWGPTPESKEWCRAWLAAHPSTVFTPP